jgi:hypothetical protein
MNHDNTATEGVIKYQLDYIRAEWYPGDIRELNAWRGILHGLGLVGQNPDLYGGLGYGNVSQRLLPGGAGFVISASQTGNLRYLQPTHYTRVDSVDFSQMVVTATGDLKPSSEALSHAMIYRLDATINCVLHVHHASVWRHALDQGYPTSAPDVEYGSAQMVDELGRLYRQSDLPSIGVLAMAGHEDGVIAFGSNPEMAGKRLLDLFLKVI